MNKSRSVAWVLILLLIFQTAAGFRLNKAYADSPFAGGSGTAGDPYLIATAAQLDAVRNYVAAGLYFKLTSDIDLSGYPDWNPIGADLTAPFQGNLDGNNHVVSKLTLAKPSSDFIGLFGMLYGGSVTNLGLEEVSVQGNYYTGGLAGYIYQGTISNCYVKGSVSGFSNVGGMVGANGGTVSKSYAAATVSGAKFYTGGLVGGNYGTVRNSYAVGSISSASSVGGLVGLNDGGNNGAIYNSYAAASVTSAGTTGGLVGWNIDGAIVSNSYFDAGISGQPDTGAGLPASTSDMKNAATFSGWEFGTVWEIDPEVNDGYPYLPFTPLAPELIVSAAPGSQAGSTAVTASVDEGNHLAVRVSASPIKAPSTGSSVPETANPYSSGADIVGVDVSANKYVGVYEANASDQVVRFALITLTGANINEFAGGKGTSISPYLISNASQLDAVRNHLGTDIYYQLTADIDLSGYENWLPIGNETKRFAGNFDGSGYTISNLSIDRPETDYIGLFGYLSYNSVIRNVRLQNIQVTGRNDVGGLAGYNNNGNIIDSSVMGQVTGVYRVGGLEGYHLGGTIAGSFAAGSVNGTGNAGGLAGLAEFSSILNSYAAADVKGNGDVNEGGLVGYLKNGSISNSYAVGNVSGSGNTGGLAGRNEGTVVNSYYDYESTGQSSASSGAKSPAEMKDRATYSNWDFEIVWGMDPSVNDGYPYLLAFPLMEDLHAVVVPGSRKGTTSVIASVGEGNRLSILVSPDKIATPQPGDLVPESALAYDSGADISAADAVNMKYIGVYEADGGNAIVKFSLITLEPGDFNQMDAGTGTANDPYLIATAAGLDAIRYRMDSGVHYKLTADIDLSGYGNWTPIGTAADPFRGSLDGGGHTITGLNVGSYANYRGLFGYAGETASITNLGLKNVTVAGADYTGGLAGYNSGAISRSYVSGSVTGGNYVGGLVGSNKGTVSDSYASGNVSGGLVVGGLAGRNDFGKISGSYAMSTVTATTAAAGGLVGSNENGTVSFAYATGRVKGNSTVGGLAGNNFFGKIRNSYAAAKVEGQDATKTGGFAGVQNGGTIEDSYYDTDETGLQDIGKGIPLSSSAMRDRSAYPEWDFDLRWGIDPDINGGYPFLRGADNDASLSGFALSSGKLSPAFASNVSSYTAYVADGTGGIRITPTLSAGSASVTASVYDNEGTLIDGPESLTSGSASSALLLSEKGDSTIRVSITAKDGTEKTYTVSAVRVSSDLSGFTLSSGKLSPDFSASVFDYKANVANGVTAVKVTASAIDDRSAVTASAFDSAGSRTAGPLALTSGTESPGIPLKVGVNKIEVVVTALEGTQKKYTVTLTREAEASQPSTGESPRTGSESPRTGGTVGETPAGGTKIRLGGLEIVGKVTEETAPDGRKTTHVTIDAEPFVEAFAASTSPSVPLDIESVNPVVNVNMPASALLEAMDKQPEAELEIRVNGATYNLPVKVIRKAPKAAVISVRIGTVSDALGDAVDAETGKEGAKPLLDRPIEFALSINGKEMTDFDEWYVDRSVSLTTPADPGKATAVWVDSEHRLHFVPSVFPNGGRTAQAVIRSPHNSAYTVIESDQTFDDLKGHWAKDDVELLANKRIVEGMTDGSYAPDRTITRAEFTALLVRSLGLPGTLPERPYTDVKETDWFAGAAGAAQKAGLISGYEDGTFRPNASITREQMAVMIAKALKLAGEEAQADGDALNGFSDRSDISGWAEGAAAQAVSNNLIQGMTDTTFAPKQYATRAQAASILRRMLQHLNFIN
ncbi:hypothetical protein GE107_19900 [Cohnella sp. CFH 77786]|uniref:GLUG motif-containing protein n=1 Tax=Cohnella sp. CFH 77786 TaxID=2662265 RepID=UPI001C60F392|nr:GLUG motif-containing protein [Cohnella sp. CFH 77786]MBW5448310.1 hypothetical protein [Cohnella sp. CFH 77786]